MLRCEYPRTATTEERSLKTVTYVYNGTPYSYGKNVPNYMNQQGCVCAQSCPIVCDPADCSLLDFSVHELFFFLRQEYWNGLPFPPPGDLHNPESKPTSSASPAAGGFFTTEPPGKPESTKIHLRNPLLGSPWWSSG